MDLAFFDVLTRCASLMTLSTASLAGLTTVAGPPTVDAKKKKKCNVNKRCKQQVRQCTNLRTAICGANPVCQDSIACCPILGSCDADAFISCLLASF
jgi:hypothetical protein